MPASAPRLRFDPSAAATLRQAIEEAGGLEVFAIGEVQDGLVVDLAVHCRGLEDRVPALLERPRAGQVVIHNHPSGDLRPSEADLALASRYGDEGVGVVIVDSALTRDNWVVEPHVERSVPVDDEAVRRFFEVDLARALPDQEPRPSQLAMALSVGAHLSAGLPVVVEAGTGTGKSLAYLVPAALWALANDRKVVISTHTRALQAQLLASDLPLLARAGLDVRSAVLQGRSNYLCKRRLGVASEEPDDEAGEPLAMLRDFDRTTATGLRADVGVRVDDAVWERVESDTDLTLRVRCPHYAECHYYVSRRRAAAAHLVVVNHALLLSDRVLRAEGAPGLLPAYDRVVLDEAHHLEDAATGVVADRVTERGVARAVAPALGRRRRPGALDRAALGLATPGGPLPAEVRGKLLRALDEARAPLETARELSPTLLQELARTALATEPALRVTPEVEADDRYREQVEPVLHELAEVLEHAAGALLRVDEALDEARVPPAHAQPVLDLQRARRRLAAHASVVRAFLEPDDAICRWMDRDGRDAPATLNRAPIEVGPLLRKVLWDAVPGAVATSATLTAGGSFSWWRARSGLDGGDEQVLASPFDHVSQALLGLPTDLPDPADPRFLDASGAAILDAVRASGGGAFVLCTSHDAVARYARDLRAALPAACPLLVQGTAPRPALLERFLDHRDAVLVGTDSFWEGVSVKGEGLRLVVIPKLPFRVPTEPLSVAQHELLTRRGLDAFRAHALPRAILRLKQGYGRLIRSRTDRGVVLVLDRRLHTRSYGPLVLKSLPPARRIKGSWRLVLSETRAFFAQRTPQAAAADAPDDLASEPNPSRPPRNTVPGEKP